MSYHVKIKWGNLRYDDVLIDTNESPLLFKSQLFTLCNVPPERQKIMLKGIILCDETWDNFDKHLKNGITLMLLGTEDISNVVPTSKPTFIEDLSEHQLSLVSYLPRGIINLGNTCYLNASIQCLRTVPELKQALFQYELRLFNQHVSLIQTHENRSFIDSLSNVLKLLDNIGDPLQPLILIQSLHREFPRFAQRGPKGGLVQQDAQECWTQMLCLLANEFKSSNSNCDDVIKQYFTGMYTTCVKSSLPSDLPDESESEEFLQLSCYIDQNVNFLERGLELALYSEFSKHSGVLGVDVAYQRISKISRLPAYLTIHMLRFDYGKVHDSEEIQSRKILREVRFPIMLDVSNLCTTELQNKFEPSRKKYKEIDDFISNTKRNSFKTKNNFKSSYDANAANKFDSFSFENDVGSNNSGYYQLLAILTHQGRSIDSGHYVAWIRGNNDEWIQLDDDKISHVDTATILKLAGGGDNHMAYLLLYAPRPLLTLDDFSQINNEQQD